MVFLDDVARKLSHRQKKRAVNRQQRMEERFNKIKEKKLNKAAKVKEENDSKKVKVEKKGFSDDNKLWLKPKQVKVESDEGRRLLLLPIGCLKKGGQDAYNRICLVHVVKLVEPNLKILSILV